MLFFPDLDESMEHLIVSSSEDNKDDLLKDYLELKTEEMKFLNSEAENELKDRKRNREKNLNLLKAEQNYRNTFLEITKCWQKIYNKKWIIGIETKNISKRFVCFFY